MSSNAADENQRWLFLHNKVFHAKGLTKDQQAAAWEKLIELDLAKVELLLIGDDEESLTNVLLRQIRGAAVQGEERVYRFTPNKKEGLQGRGYRASRATTLKNLLWLIATVGLVVIKGSPMTGKTSMMQQLAELADHQGWASVLYISAAAGSAIPTVSNLVAAALKHKGRTWSDLWGSPSPRPSAAGQQQQGGSSSDAGQAQDYTASELTLLLIDEAQLVFANSGQDTEFWNNMKSLQQGFVFPRTRRTIRVAMFALYGDAPSGAPCTGPSVSPIPFTNVVSFKADDNSSHGVQLALDSTESEELWESFIHQNNLGPFFQDQKLRHALLELTAGHVGLLVTFLDKLDKKLQSVPRVWVGHGDVQIRDMFTKGEIYLPMMKEVRGVITELAALDEAEPIMEALVKAGSEGCSRQELRDAWMNADPVKRTTSEAAKYVNKLYYQGFIVQNPTADTFHLVSPLHQSFYLTQLSTLRYEELPLDSDADFDAFLRHSIRRISGSAMKTSLSKRRTEDGRVYERHYQVEWYKAAKSCLPPASVVSPDVGKVYSCDGAVDFWVQTSPGAAKGWAVELLVHGDRAADHEARFASDGKYARLPCAQKALLDFWTEPYIIRHQRSPHYYIVQLATDFRTAEITAADNTKKTVELLP